jgi:DNA-binding SARP family transcriptional activator/Tfp pilus assembly protein PilF
VDTRKAIALLSYLTVEKSADRETLATLFWGDAPPDRARGTLRRTLSALRTAIGADSIVADRTRVTLPTGYRSDIDLFDAAVEETSTHDHSASEVCPLCVTPLRRAAGLYRSEFLGAFAVRDAPDFEDWARSVTETYRLRAGDVFSRLAMAYAAAGGYTAAIDAASRWIKLDELHEPAYRQLMLLNAWAGHRPGAIEAYRHCVAVLDRELGVAPLEETTELYEAILDEDLPPAPAVRRSVKSVKPVAPPAVGEMLDRSDAIGTLHLALERAQEGSHFCLVTGDSWMGKTRLIEHLTEEAAARGTITVSGKAYRAETMIPYGVATQLLRPLVEELESSDLPVWALEELTRLDPKLAAARAPTDSERLGQVRLREAFLVLVESVAAVGPTVITVDDAQWMDTVTASLLAYLIRRLDDVPVLIVVSAREAAALDPALRDSTVMPDDHIDLRPLDADDIRSDFPDTDVDAIVAATGGIPLLVDEGITSGSVATDSINVTRYMESRRQRLSDLGLQVLTAAAVLDGLCDAALLRDTSGRTEDEIVDAVEELVGAKLLREDADGRLGFTLDVLESATYEATSLIRRRLLHRRAAEALGAQARSRTDARLASAVAGHLRMAGADESADWYRISGDLARAVFANAEAVTAYENAIALGHPDVGDLRLNLGELAMVRGDYQTATRELRAAASRATGPDLARVEHRLGDLNRVLGRFDLAEESFARARDQHPVPAELLADWALLKHRNGESSAAIALATEAHEAAEAENDDRQIARTLNILGVASPDPEQAMEYFERALEKVGLHGPERMAALNNKAQRLSETGDQDAAVALVEEAIAIAGRAGYRHHQAALLNHLADLKHRSGLEGEARAALTEAVKIFADIDAGEWEPEVWLLREW